MSASSSSRRREQRAPLFEVQEKAPPKHPRPIETILDGSFDDLTIAPRATQRQMPRLRDEPPAAAPIAELAPVRVAPAHPATPAAKPAAKVPAFPLQAGALEAAPARKAMIEAPAAPRYAPAAPRAAVYDRPTYARTPAHDAYPHWDAPIEAARRQPWLLILVAIVCGAIVVSMYSAPAKTVLSRFGLASPAAPSQDTSDIAPIVAANVPAGEHSLIGQPSISATAIDEVLKGYGSPVAGTGAAWVAAGKRYQIDPAFALAFFIHESSAGTNPAWAGFKGDGSSTHNVGNIICAGYPTCYGRFRDYDSWETGIDDWYKLIHNEYIEGRGVQTLEQIIPIYAPSSENNVPAYVQSVMTLVDGWRQGVLQ